MKELCDKLMKLNPESPYGDDFSTIALSLFLREEGFGKDKFYDISEYTKYLYRFYSDIDIIRNKHYHKLINELWHYQPGDILNYSKGVLEYIQNSNGLIKVFGNSFVLLHCPKDVTKYEKVLDGVIQTLVAKYVGSEYREYDSRLDVSEYENKEVFYLGDRVFYRALELTNYCFMCDQFELKKLCAIRLQNKKIYDQDNYLIMCKEHADAYKNNKLVIKKNGYPYIGGKRMYEHIEISVLRKIRDNLVDI